MKKIIQIVRDIHTIYHWHTEKKEKNINGYIIESYVRLLCKGSEQENNQKGNRQHRKVFKQLISNLH